MSDLRNRLSVTRQRRRNTEDFHAAPKPKAGSAKLLHGAAVIDRDKTRLWNLSDDPSKNGGSGAEVIMVISKNIAPGQAVELKKSEYEASKRLQDLVESGRLFEGMSPPDSYLQAKSRLRLSIPRAHSRRLKDSPERKAARAARQDLGTAEEAYEARVEELDDAKEALSELESEVVGGKVLATAKQAVADAESALEGAKQAVLEAAAGAANASKELGAIMPKADPIDVPSVAVAVVEAPSVEQLEVPAPQPTEATAEQPETKRTRGRNRGSSSEE